MQHPRPSVNGLQRFLINLSVKLDSNCPNRGGLCLLIESRQGEQMVGDFILYLALIQLGATAAITAIVVGALYLLYQSVLNRSPGFCDGVDK